MRQNPDKTDYSDARMLADLERVGYLPKVWLAPRAVREMRLLVRYRIQQVAQRRNIKLRIGAVLREQRLKNNSHGRWSIPWRWWVQHEAALSEQGRWVVDQHLKELEHKKVLIAEVEKRLEETCKTDPLIRRLMEITGIGKVTAWMFRAEVGRFDRFRNGKQLARFCGLSPRNASSGMRQADAGLIKSANKDLRTIAMEAAHRLIRTDRRWGEMALRLRTAGKAPNVTVAAVANRWVRWLFNEVRRPSAA
jgi:transposase